MAHALAAALLAALIAGWASVETAPPAVGEERPLAADVVAFYEQAHARGEPSHTVAKLWKQYLIDFLSETERK